MEKTCPKCGSKAPECKSQYCDKCGTKLPERAVCEKCGKLAPSCNSLFCDHCGTPFPATHPQHVGKVCPSCGNIAPTTQSVFCDICGGRLTTIAPGMLAEEQLKAKVKENTRYSVPVLIFAFILGIVSFFINPLNLVIVIVLSAYAVYNDATELRAGSLFEKRDWRRPVTWRPRAWGLLVLVVWIIGLPLYLVKREQLLGLYLGEITPESLVSAPPTVDVPAPVVEPVVEPVGGPADPVPPEPAPEPAQELESLPEAPPESAPEPAAASPAASFPLVAGVPAPEMAAAPEGVVAARQPGAEPPVITEIPGIITGIPGMGTEAAPQPVSDATPEQKPGSPTRLSLIAGVIVLILIVIAMLFLSGAVPVGSILPSGNFTANATMAATSSPSAVPTTPPPEINIVKAGDSASDGRQKLSVTQIAFLDTIGTTKPGDLAEGDAKNKFLVATISVENVQLLSNLKVSEFSAIDGEGYLYPSLQVDGTEDPFDSGTELGPLEKRSGNLVFSVKPGVTGLRLMNVQPDGEIALLPLN